MSFRTQIIGFIPEDKRKEAETVLDALDKTMDGYSTDIDDLKKQLRKTNGIKPEDFAALEKENADLKAKYSDLERTAKKFETEAKGATEKLTAEQVRIRNLEVDRALTEQLTKAKVKPELMAAAKALLKSGTDLEQDGEGFKVVAKWKDKDGKDAAGPLSDFIEKTWAQGEGKAFILADGNGGGGSGQVNRDRGSGKTLTRAQVEALPPEQQLAFAREGGAVTE